MMTKVFRHIINHNAVLTSLHGNQDQIFHGLSKIQKIVQLNDITSTVLLIDGNYSIYHFNVLKRSVLVIER